jgi:hypothetical protein
VIRIAEDRDIDEIAALLEAADDARLVSAESVRHWRKTLLERARIIDVVAEHSIGATKATSFIRWTAEGERKALARGWSRVLPGPLIALDPRGMPEPSPPTGFRCVAIGELGPEAIYEAVREEALGEPSPVSHDDFRFDQFMCEWQDRISTATRARPSSTSRVAWPPSRSSTSSASAASTGSPGLCASTAAAAWRRRRNGALFVPRALEVSCG